jgi:hypothetical protein
MESATSSTTPSPVSLSTDEVFALVTKETTTIDSKKVCCVYCMHSFNVFNVFEQNLVKAHILGKDWNGSQTKACKSKQVPSEIKQRLNAEYNLNRKRKLAEVEAEAPASNQDTRTSIANVTATAAEDSIICCLAVLGIAPNVVDHWAWKHMIRSVRDAPRTFDGINRKMISKSFAETRLTVLIRVDIGIQNGTFGRVLASSLDHAKKTKTNFLDSIIGATLCSDGAKNFKRSALNSILVSVKGKYFIQSTEATGLSSVRRQAKAVNAAGDDTVLWLLWMEHVRRLLT